MKVVLFVPTASVDGNRPSAWLAQRLDVAVEYTRTHKDDECIFVLSGRWKNVTDAFMFTEAEVAKRYIMNVLPSAVILKEEISVETGGNFVFSKPVIKELQPDKVCIFNSRVNAARVEYFAKKIFGNDFVLEFNYIDDTFSQNERAQKKEPKALIMFQKILSHVQDGNAAEAREILLHRTPFYNKGVVDDKDFFDAYWPGGYDDFREKRLSIDNK